jgi:hypothetical protein
LTDRRTRSDILTPFNWSQERGIAVGLATVGGKPRVVAVPEGIQVTSVIVSIELVDLRLKGPWEAVRTWTASIGSVTHLDHSLWNVDDSALLAVHSVIEGGQDSIVHGSDRTDLWWLGICEGESAVRRTTLCETGDRHDEKSDSEEQHGAGRLLER